MKFPITAFVVVAATAYGAAVNPHGASSSKDAESNKSDKPVFYLEDGLEWADKQYPFELVNSTSGYTIEKLFHKQWDLYASRQYTHQELFRLCLEDQESGVPSDEIETINVVRFDHTDGHGVQSSKLWCIYSGDNEEPLDVKVPEASESYLLRRKHEICCIQ